MRKNGDWRDRKKDSEKTKSSTQGHNTGRCLDVKQLSNKTSFSPKKKKKGRGEAVGRHDRN